MGLPRQACAATEPERLALTAGDSHSEPYGGTGGGCERTDEPTGSYVTHTREMRVFMRERVTSERAASAYPLL